MTLIEDFLLAAIDDEDQLARVMNIELRLAEMPANCLHVNSVRCAAYTLELGVKRIQIGKCLNRAKFTYKPSEKQLISFDICARQK